MLKYFTIRKLQIRTIERYHYTPKRMATSEEKKKKPGKAISGEDTEQTGQNNIGILWTILCKSKK